MAATLGDPAPRELTGASILVVGATGVLGQLIARTMHAAGSTLTLHGRSAERLAAIADELPGSASLLADIRDAGAGERLVAASLARNGRLDGVVIASGAVAFGTLQDTDAAVAEDLYLTNALGPSWIIAAALPALQASGGFVCAITGIVAANPFAGMAAYCGTKAALASTLASCRRETPTVDFIDVQPPHTETGLAGRAVAGVAPRFPIGLTPSSVAAEIVAAIVARRPVTEARQFS
jgi:NADP-dependent 3-hydroxy acid dehydrogenase YdfG